MNDSNYRAVGGLVKCSEEKHGDLNRNHDTKMTRQQSISNIISKYSIKGAGVLLQQKVRKSSHVCN